MWNGIPIVTMSHWEAALCLCWRDQWTISSAHQRRGAEAALSSFRLFCGARVGVTPSPGWWRFEIACMEVVEKMQQEQRIEHGRTMCSWDPSGIRWFMKAIAERCNIVSVVNMTAPTACPSQHTACGKMLCCTPSFTPLLGRSCYCLSFLLVIM